MKTTSGARYRVSFLCIIIENGDNYYLSFLIVFLGRFVGHSFRYNELGFSGNLRSRPRAARSIEPNLIARLLGAGVSIKSLEINIRWIVSMVVCMVYLEISVINFRDGVINRKKILLEVNAEIL